MAAPSHVQSVKVTGNAVTAVTTPTMTTTAGNALGAAVNRNGVPENFTSITDSKGNTWPAAIVSGVFAEGVFQRIHALDAPASVGSGHSVTFTFSANGFPSGVFWEISGQDTSTPRVTAVTEAETAGSTSHTGDALTTTINDCLLIGIACHDGTIAATFTIDASWTAQQQYNTAAGQSGILFGTKVKATAGAEGFAFATSVSQKCVITTLAYIPAGGSPAATPRLLALLGVGS